MPEHGHPEMKQPSRQQGRWRPPVLGTVAACAALGAVFALYTQPAFLRDLADRLWSCF